MHPAITRLPWRVRCVLWILDHVPQIRMIALCNSRAMGEDHADSDIDLFVITSTDRLWTGRAMTTLIAQIFGVRRGSTRHMRKGSKAYLRATRNKLCLSFFITETSLDLTPLRIEHDIYMDRWISTLIPIIHHEDIYERFLLANTGKSQTPQARPRHRVGTFLEYLIRRLWMPHTYRSYEALGRPWGVTISDTVLKFHDKDQRIIYRDQHR